MKRKSQAGLQCITKFFKVNDIDKTPKSSPAEKYPDTDSDSEILFLGHAMNQGRGGGNFRPAFRGGVTRRGGAFPVTQKPMRGFPQFIGRGNSNPGFQGNQHGNQFRDQQLQGRMQNNSMQNRFRPLDSSMRDSGFTSVSGGSNRGPCGPGFRGFARGNVFTGNRSGSPVNLQRQGIQDMNQLNERFGRQSLNEPGQGDYMFVERRGRAGHIQRGLVRVADRGVIRRGVGGPRGFNQGRGFVKPRNISSSSPTVPRGSSSSPNLSRGFARQQDSPSGRYKPRNRSSSPSQDRGHIKPRDNSNSPSYIRRREFASPNEKGIQRPRTDSNDREKLMNKVPKEKKQQASWIPLEEDDAKKSEGTESSPEKLKSSLEKQKSSPEKIKSSPERMFSDPEKTDLSKDCLSQEEVVSSVVNVSEEEASGKIVESCLHEKLGDFKDNTNRGACSDEGEGNRNNNSRTVSGDRRRSETDSGDRRRSETDSGDRRRSETDSGARRSDNTVSSDRRRSETVASERSRRETVSGERSRCETVSGERSRRETGSGERSRRETSSGVRSRHKVSKRKVSNEKATKTKDNFVVFRKINMSGFHRIGNEQERSIGHISRRDTARRLVRSHSDESEYGFERNKTTFDRRLSPDFERRREPRSGEIFSEHVSFRDPYHSRYRRFESLSPSPRYIHTRSLSREHRSSSDERGFEGSYPRFEEYNSFSLSRSVSFERRREEPVSRFQKDHFQKYSRDERSSSGERRKPESVSFFQKHHARSLSQDTRSSSGERRNTDKSFSPFEKTLPRSLSSERRRMEELSFQKCNESGRSGSVERRRVTESVSAFQNYLSKSLATTDRSNSDDGSRPKPSFANTSLKERKSRASNECNRGLSDSVRSRKDFKFRSYGSSQRRESGSISQERFEEERPLYSPELYGQYQNYNREKRTDDREYGCDSSEIIISSDSDTSPPQDFRQRSKGGFANLSRGRIVAGESLDRERLNRKSLLDRERLLDRETVLDRERLLHRERLNDCNDSVDFHHLHRPKDDAESFQFEANHDASSDQRDDLYNPCHPIETESDQREDDMFDFERERFRDSPKKDAHVEGRTSLLNENMSDISSEFEVEYDVGSTRDTLCDSLSRKTLESTKDKLEHKILQICDEADEVDHFGFKDKERCKDRNSNWKVVPSASRESSDDKFFAKTMPSETGRLESQSQDKEFEDDKVPLKNLERDQKKSTRKGNFVNSCLKEGYTAYAYEDESSSSEEIEKVKAPPKIYIDFRKAPIRRFSKEKIRDTRKSLEDTEVQQSNFADKVTPEDVSTVKKVTDMGSSDEASSNYDVHELLEKTYNEKNAIFKDKGDRRNPLNVDGDDVDKKRCELTGLKNRRTTVVSDTYQKYKPDSGLQILSMEKMRRLSHEKQRELERRGVSDSESSSESSPKFTRIREKRLSSGSRRSRKKSSSSNTSMSSSSSSSSSTSSSSESHVGRRKRSLKGSRTPKSYSRNRRSESDSTINSTDTRDGRCSDSSSTNNSSSSRSSHYYYSSRRWKPWWHFGYGRHVFAHASKPQRKRDRRSVSVARSKLNFYEKFRFKSKQWLRAQEEQIKEAEQKLIEESISVETVTKENSPVIKQSSSELVVATQSLKITEIGETLSTELDDDLPRLKKSSRSNIKWNKAEKEALKENQIESHIPDSDMDDSFLRSKFPKNRTEHHSKNIETMKKRPMSESKECEVAIKDKNDAGSSKFESSLSKLQNLSVKSKEDATQNSPVDMNKTGNAVGVKVSPVQRKLKMGIGLAKSTSPKKSFWNDKQKRRFTKSFIFSPTKKQTPKVKPLATVSHRKLFFEDILSPEKSSSKEDLEATKEQMSSELQNNFCTLKGNLKTLEGREDTKKTDLNVLHNPPASAQTKTAGPVKDAKAGRDYLLKAKTSSRKGEVSKVTTSEDPPALTRTKTTGIIKDVKAVDNDLPKAKTSFRGKVSKDTTSDHPSTPIPIKTAGPVKDAKAVEDDLTTAKTCFREREVSKDTTSDHEEVDMDLDEEESSGLEEDTTCLEPKGTHREQSGASETAPRAPETSCFTDASQYSAQLAAYWSSQGYPVGYPKPNCWSGGQYVMPYYSDPCYNYQYAGYENSQYSVGQSCRNVTSSKQPPLPGDKGTTQPPPLPTDQGTVEPPPLPKDQGATQQIPLPEDKDNSQLTPLPEHQGATQHPTLQENKGIAQLPPLPKDQGITQLSPLLKGKSMAQPPPLSTDQGPTEPPPLPKGQGITQHQPLPDDHGPVQPPPILGYQRLTEQLTHELPLQLPSEDRQTKNAKTNPENQMLNKYILQPQEAFSRSSQALNQFSQTPILASQAPTVISQAPTLPSKAPTLPSQAPTLPSQASVVCSQSLMHEQSSLKPPLAVPSISPSVYSPSIVPIPVPVPPPQQVPSQEHQNTSHLFQLPFLTSLIPSIDEIQTPKPVPPPKDFKCSSSPLTSLPNPQTLLNTCAILSHKLSKLASPEKTMKSNEPKPVPKQKMSPSSVPPKAFVLPSQKSPKRDSLPIPEMSNVKETVSSSKMSTPISSDSKSTVNIPQSPSSGSSDPRKRKSSGKSSKSSPQDTIQTNRQTSSGDSHQAGNKEPVQLKSLSYSEHLATQSKYLQQLKSVLTSSLVKSQSKSSMESVPKDRRYAKRSLSNPAQRTPFIAPVPTFASDPVTNLVDQRNVIGLSDSDYSDVPMETEYKGSISGKLTSDQSNFTDRDVRSLRFNTGQMSNEQKCANTDFLPIYTNQNLPSSHQPNDVYPAFQPSYPNQIHQSSNPQQPTSTNLDHQQNYPKPNLQPTYTSPAPTRPSAHHLNQPTYANPDPSTHRMNQSTYTNPEHQPTYTNQEHQPTYTNQDPSAHRMNQSTYTNPEHQPTYTNQEHQPTYTNQDPSAHRMNQSTYTNPEHQPTYTNQDPSAHRMNQSTYTNQDPSAHRMNQSTYTNPEHQPTYTNQDPAHRMNQSTYTNQEHQPTYTNQDPSAHRMNQPTYTNQDPSTHRMNQSTYTNQDPAHRMNQSTYTNPEHQPTYTNQDPSAHRMNQSTYTNPEHQPTYTNQDPAHRMNQSTYTNQEHQPTYTNQDPSAHRMNQSTYTNPEHQPTYTNQDPSAHRMNQSTYTNPEHQPTYTNQDPAHVISPSLLSSSASNPSVSINKRSRDPRLQAQAKRQDKTRIAIKTLFKTIDRYQTSTALEKHELGPAHPRISRLASSLAPGVTKTPESVKSDGKTTSGILKPVDLQKVFEREGNYGSQRSKIDSDSKDIGGGYWKGLGDTNIPHGRSQSTSVSSPAVAGTAAVVSKTLQSSALPKQLPTAQASPFKSSPSSAFAVVTGPASSKASTASLKSNLTAETAESLKSKPDSAVAGVSTPAAVSFLGSSQQCSPVAALSKADTKKNGENISAAISAVKTIQPLPGRGITSVASAKCPASASGRRSRPSVNIVVPVVEIPKDVDTKKSSVSPTENVSNLLSASSKDHSLDPEPSATPANESKEHDLELSIEADEELPESNIDVAKDVNSEVAPKNVDSEVAPKNVDSEVAPKNVDSEVAPKDVDSEVAPKDADLSKDSWRSVTPLKITKRNVSETLTSEQEPCVPDAMDTLSFESKSAESDMKRGSVQLKHMSMSSFSSDSQSSLLSEKVRGLSHKDVSEWVKKSSAQRLFEPETSSHRHKKHKDKRRHHSSSSTSPRSNRDLEKGDDGKFHKSHRSHKGDTRRPTDVSPRSKEFLKSKSVDPSEDSSDFPEADSEGMESMRTPSKHKLLLDSSQLSKLKASFAKSPLLKSKNSPSTQGTKYAPEISNSLGSYKIPKKSSMLTPGSTEKEKKAKYGHNSKGSSKSEDETSPDHPLNSSDSDDDLFNETPAFLKEFEETSKAILNAPIMNKTVDHLEIESTQSNDSFVLEEGPVQSVAVNKPDSKSTFSLDALLAERVENEETERELQFMQKELKEVIKQGGFVRLAEEDVEEDDLLPEHHEKLEYFQVSENTIQDEHPGDTVLHPGRFPCVYTQTLSPLRCGFQPGNSFIETHLANIQPDALTDLLTTDMLSMCFHLIKGQEEVLRWIFFIMCVHEDSCVVQGCKKLLFDIIHSQLAGDESTSTWAPALPDVLKVLVNFGGDSKALLGSQRLYSEEEIGECVLPENDVDLLQGKGNVSTRSYAENIREYLQTLAFALQGRPPYSAVELNTLFLMVAKLAMEKELAQNVLLYEFTVVISSLVKCYSDEDWDAVMPGLCFELSGVTSHHHNREYLAQLFHNDPRSTGIQRRLAYLLLYKILLPRISVNRMQLINFKLRNLAVFFPKLRDLAENDLYALYSAICLMDIAVGNEQLKGSEKVDLQYLMELLRSLTSDIRDNVRRLDHTRVKDLMVRISSKWTVTLQITSSKQRSMFAWTKQKSPQKMQVQRLETGASDAESEEEVGEEEEEIVPMEEDCVTDDANKPNHKPEDTTNDINVTQSENDMDDAQKSENGVTHQSTVDSEKMADTESCENQNERTCVESLVTDENLNSNNNADKDIVKDASEYSSQQSSASIKKEVRIVLEDCRLSGQSQDVNMSSDDESLPELDLTL